MSKPQKYREVIKFLKSRGWVMFRQGKGDHEIWGDPQKPELKVTIPHHAEVSAGVISQLRRAISNTPNNWK